MHAKDFKIGNYIRVDGELRIVSALFEQGLIYTKCENGSDSVKCPVSVVKPIIITPDWLRKLNLPISYQNQHYSIYIFEEPLFGLTFDYGKGLDRFNVTMDGNQMKTINYIHQLQNIYYCLCNSVLTMSYEV